MIVFVSKLLAPALSPIMIACELWAVAILTVRGRPRVARGAGIAGLLVLLLASNQFFSTLVAGYLESRNLPDGPLPHAQAIVVLSSDAEPATPPQPTIALDSATANRLLYAAQLYHDGEAPTVILSGGRVPWLRSLPPESQSMLEVMELLGVPKSAIVQESQSANTYENAVNVKAMLKDRHIDRILLVTSAMHMPRALALFKDQGIDAIAAPCDFLPFTPQADWRGTIIGLIPDPNSLNRTSMAVNEFLGIAVYHAAGLL